jgi:hypothetical protein
LNDPKRLLEEGPTELERSLLSAVAAEQPSSEHRMRVREAMGLADAGGPASATRTASSSTGKMVMVGVVGAGAVAALLLLGRARQAAPAPIAPAPQEVPAAPVVPEVSPATAAPEAPPAVEPSDPAVAPRATHRTSVAAPSASSDIREQIRLIDEARSAVAAHDAASALRTLDQYRSKFPGGALDQEATVLRIEALDQRGDHAQAASMARAFLARNPASAHATRLQRIAAQ